MKTMRRTAAILMVLLLAVSAAGAETLSLNGTVTGVFAREGDDAEKVTETYGADLYIEGNTQ